MNSAIPPQRPVTSAAVHADIGGWLSGPMLATNREPEPSAPPVLQTVLHVAQLGQDLPEWRVMETRAGWTAIRGAGSEPVIRVTLPALESAMFAAELAIVRAEYPGWSVRRTEHGEGWTAVHGGPPVLHARTLGELSAAITEHETKQ